MDTVLKISPVHIVKTLMKLSKFKSVGSIVACFK